jgi:Ala-tRNA(Pro) deacylase
MSLVTEYLDACGVSYEVVHSEPSIASPEDGRALHTDTDLVLKAFVIDARGRHAVAVIPASRQLDMRRVREALDDPSAHLVTEDELLTDYPGIEMGSGVPVLGRLLDAETIVDPSVLGRGRVVFTAGTWTGEVRARTIDLFGGDRAPFVPLVAERATDGIAG